jgi:hypothetical protein
MAIRLPYLFLMMLSLIVISSINAQQNISINWGESITTSVNNQFSLEYQADNGIRFSKIIAPASNYKLVNQTLKPISENELVKIKDAPEDLGFKSKTVKARKQKKTIVQINAIVKRNNQFYKVLSFDIQSDASRNNSDDLFQTNSATIVNSAFAQGDWYKFYVEKTGVYQIDSGFLNALGINTSNINPQKIKILSHGGKMLPLLNSENQYYDPPEIPLQIIGGGDGSFDPGDRIRFYATATSGEYDPENDTHLNLYADRAYYYISVEGSNGKRLFPFSQPNDQPVETVDSFTDEKYYEVDEVSPSLVGRRWYGDRFDITNERSYGFNFPNLITDTSAQIFIKAAAIANNETSMSVQVNGEEILDNGEIFEFDDVDSDMPSTSSSLNEVINPQQDSISVDLNYNKNGNPAATAFLNYIRIKADRSLTYNDGQLIFTYQKNNPASEVIRFNLSNTSEVDQVWDISEWTSINSVTNTQNANDFSFSLNITDQPKKFVAFSNDQLLRPRFEGGNIKINNQNLKGNIFTNAQGETEPVDYIVVARESYLQPAKRLADFRAQLDNLNTRVVFLNDIYEEFNSGKPDIAAIRNFVKYVYDNAPNNQALRYLTLLGDTSVDYKDRIQNNTNVIPTYQRLHSSRTDVNSFMSDDFYTMMDPNEGRMNPNDLMDLAVGRILADSPNRANKMIDKIISYEQRSSFSRYRNDFLLISDDVDESWEHETIQTDLDELGDEIEANKPFINVRKIHSDAYQQETSAGGDRYPEAKQDINNQIELGVAVVNYFGHGGEEGLAQERLVTEESGQNWLNPDRFNIFLTVTCEYTRFDNPLRQSAGESAYYNENGGPVAMMTTTRAISVGAGVSFNNEVAPFLFDYENQGITAGQAVQQTKNNLSGSGKRIVFYLGDPAMNLPYAQPNIKLTEINGTPINQFADTLKALSNVQIKGEIVDNNDQRISNFSGKISATIFDKRIQRSTLGNDNTTGPNGEVLILDFTTLGEALFRGNASVNEGAFSFDFLLPKDTKIPVGNGKISLYALRDGMIDDYTGSRNDILIGDLNENAASDNQGPEINLFMNDETFVDGGITNSSPFLLAKLADENGINTAGGIGHNITAILDGDEQNPITLNDYYEAAEDDFTQGEVYFKLRDLSEGEHTIEFKAWDSFNNSSIAKLNFRVAEEDGLVITKVLNYPNPFTDYTEFWFNHNRPPMETLEVQVQVFTVTGKVVWSHRQTVATDGFLSRDITWNGRDDFGQRIGKGVYIYKLTVKSTVTQQKKEKIEKLVIL